MGATDSRTSEIPAIIADIWASMSPEDKRLLRTGERTTTDIDAWLSYAGCEPSIEWPFIDLTNVLNGLLNRSMAETLAPFPSAFARH